MVNEAEANKSKDEEARKMIDLKNEADQFIYNTEKQLVEHSARIPQNVKDDVKKDISALNEAVVSEDAEKITESLERLKNSSMEIGKAIYSQGNDESNEQAEESTQSEDAEKKDEEKTEEEKKEEEKKEEEKK